VIEQTTRSPAEMATTRSCSDLAGKNVVTDFSHGDHLEFDGVFQNFQAVQAASHQVGADTVISLDADHSVTLVDVSVASLHASDFLLH
ncbi:MAG: calcium-binding protein, partial [Pseudolabrys sp.]